MPKNLFDNYTVGLAATSYASGIPIKDKNVDAVNLFLSADRTDVFNRYGEQGVAEQRRIQETFDAAKRPIRDRTTSEYFHDGAKAINQGLLLGAQGIAGVSEAVNRLIDPKDYVGNALRSANDYFGFKNRGPVSEQLGGLVNTIQESKSEPIRQRGERAADEYTLRQSQRGEENPIRRLLGEVYDTAVTTGTDPSLVIDKGLQAAGSSVLPGGVGAKVARNVINAGGSKVAAGAAANAASAGIEGLIEGGVSASESYRQVSQIPIDQLYEKSEEFRKLVDSGVPVKVARDKLANRISLQTLLSVGASSATIAALGPRVESQLFSGALRRPLHHSGDNALSIAGGIIQQTAGEALEEGTQELAQTILSRAAVSRADETIDILDGAGKAAVEGALGGAGLSAISNSPRAAGVVTKASAKVAGRTAAYVGQEIADITAKASDIRTGENKIPNEDKPKTTAEKVAAKVKETVDKVKDKTKDKAKDEPKVLDAKEQAKNESIQEAQKTYNKFSKLLEKPTEDSVSKLKGKNKARLAKATKDIVAIAEEYQVYQVQNFGDKSKKPAEVVEQLDRAEKFLRSKPVKRFLNVRDILDLETTESVKEILKVYRDSNPANSNISKVQREALIEGFDYYDEKTNQTVRLHGLLQYDRALELAEKADNGYTIINNKVVRTKEVLAQLSIFNRSYRNKANAAIKSVNEGNIDVEYSKNNGPIRINADAESRVLGENIINEANAINKFVNNYRRSNGGKDIKDTVLELPKQPTDVGSDTGGSAPQVQEPPVLKEKEKKENDVFSVEETSIEEFKAIQSHATVLRIFNNGKSKTSPEQDKILETLFKNKKPNYKGNLYRGSNGYDVAGSNPKVGDKIDFDEVKSFSKNINVAYNYAGIKDANSKTLEPNSTIIILDKGQGYDISSLETGKDKQEEVLIPAGKSFYISEIEQRGNGLFILISENQVDAVPSSGTASQTVEPDVDQTEFKISEKTEQLIEKGDVSKDFIDNLADLPRRPNDTESIFQQVYRVFKDPITTKRVDELLSDRKTQIDLQASQDIMKGGEAFINLVKPLMNKSLNAAEDRGKSVVQSFYDLVAKDHIGVSATGFGSLAIIQPDGTGYKYNDWLIDAALWGAFDWVMNSSARPVFKNDIIANIFGIEESQVTSVHQEALQFGLTRKQALESLSRYIRGYWNARDNADLPRNTLNGLVGDLAAEIYENLLNNERIEEKGFLVPVFDEDGNQKIDKKGNPVLTEVKTAKIQNERAKAFVAKVGSNNIRKFSKLFNTNFKAGFYLGAKIPRYELDKYQQGSRVKLTEENLDAVEKASGAPNYYNEGFADFILNLEEGALEALLGTITAGAEGIHPNTNKAHAINIQGKNLTNSMLVALANDVKDSVEDYAGQLASVGRSTRLRDIAVYFRHRMIKSSRIVQTPWGPIPNKVVRELFNNATTTLDFTNADDTAAYWLSIAVGLDIKIKNLPADNIHQNIKDAANKEINEKFSRTLPLLTNWIIENDGKQGQAIPKEISNALMGDLNITFGYADKDVTQKIPEAPEFREIHTLFAHARFLAAERTNKLNNFEHSLPIEVDGVTNGTINNLLNLMPTIGDRIKNSDFNGLRKNLRLLSKGGIFFRELGSQYDTLNEADETDIYESSGEITAQFLNAPEDWSGKTGIIRSTTRLLNALDIINSTGSGDDVSYNVPRSVQKNPVTKRGYGAGPGSTAGGFAHDTLKAIYAAIEQERVDLTFGLEESRIYYEDMQQDFDRLFGKGIKVEELFNADRVTKYAINFEFTESHKNWFFNAMGAGDTKYSVNKNGPTGVGSVIYASTDSLIGNLNSTSEVLIDAYLMMAQAASKWLQAELDRYGKDGDKAGEVISKKEEDALLTEATKLFGLEIETPFGAINPSSRLKRVTNSTMSSLSQKVRAKFSKPGIDPNPGVSSIPLIIIGLGDAAVVKEVFEQALGDAYTQFYDAFDLTADRNVFDKVKQINKAMFDTLISVNIPEYFLKSFETANKTGLLEAEALTKFGPSGKYTVDNKSVLFNLSKLADNTSIANAAFKDSNVAIQHYNISDPRATFTNEGKGQGTTVFNGVGPERLERINNTDEVTRDVGSISVKASSFVELTRNKLKNLRKTDSYTASVAAVYESVYKTITEQNLDFEIVFGNRKGLPKELNADDKKAAIDIVNNTIYIKADNKFKSNTPIEELYSSIDENVLHEVIHGLTVATMYKHYSGKTVNEDVAQSITRLEKLADRFKRFDTGKGDLTSTQRDLVVDLQNILKKIESESATTKTEDDVTAYSKAVGLSEFVAHFLANKEIVGIGKRLSVPEELKKLARRVMDTVRKLWGIRTKNESLFEAIKFEFDIIITNGLDNGTNNEVLGQAVAESNESPYIFNTAYLGSRKALFEGANDKLKTVFNSYWARTYNSELSPDKNEQIGKAAAKGAKKALTKQAQESLNIYTAGGFSLGSKQNEKIFKVVHMLYNSGVGDNTPAITRLVNVFDHVATQIKLKDLGQRKFDSVFKNQGKDVLAGFLALSQSSEEFRNVINQIELPGDIKLSDKSIDGYVNFVFNKLLNKVFNLMHGNPAKGVDNNSELIDNLVESLIKVSDPSIIDRATRYSNKGLDVADAKVSSIIKKIGEIGGIISDEGFGVNKKNIEEYFINLDSHLIKGLYREIAGSNLEIEPILSLARRATSEAQKARQEDLVQIPRILADLFKKGITQDQRDSLYESLLRTDLVNLGDFKAVVGIVETDATLDAEILRLTAEVNKVSNLYSSKIAQLVKYMNTGAVGSNLLRNANAIGALLGDHRITRENARKLANTPGLIGNIDDLVTLLALKGKPDDLATLRELIKQDKAALKVSFEAAARLSREESRKRNANKEDLVSFNFTKGFVPKDKNNGQHIVIAALENEDYLATLGYEITRSYYDPIERKEFAEFYSDRSQHAPFIEGALQIVNTGHQDGIDTQSGLDISGHGIFGSPISAREGRGVQILYRTGNSYSIDYVTVYRPDGSIKGYQRVIDPNKLSTEQRAKYDIIVNKSDFLKVLGSWRGRLKEESVGEAFNEELVDRLHDNYTDSNNKGLFVNLAETKDAVYKDVWNKVPYKTRQYIESTFGKDRFFVRKDLIDNALGYALPTLTDPFTRVSRLSEESQRFLRSSATLILGKNAYKHLTNINTVTIGVVKHTKETVIIRSLIVPYLNVLSDFVHLLSNGVTPKEIYRNTKRVLVELDFYTKRQVEETELKLKIQSVKGSQKTALNARITAIQNSYTKLSIYPLIKEGHFSTITEGLSETDRLAVGGKMAEYFGKIYDDLPKGAQEGIRQTLIARDTALFKGMAKTIQFSTIISKSIYFEHSLKQGKTEVEALAATAEEFVNYDLLPGRIRSFGDAFGVTWFFNYKLRILKIAKNLLIEHPVRAFLYSILGPYASIIDAGGPVADNVLSVLADGRGDDAVGMWRVLRGFTLHPVAQLFGLN